MWKKIKQFFKFKKLKELYKKWVLFEEDYQDWKNDKVK